MAASPVSLRFDGSSAVLTLDDAARRNALSSPMVAAIRDAVSAAEASAARSLIVAATGPAFCAGAELDTLLQAADGEFELVTDVYEAFLAVRRSNLLTIAVVEGPAVGAGFNLALACDLRVAGPRARFESRFARLRLHPGGGHLWMLQRVVGPQNALRLALLGEVWDADTALANALVVAVDDDPIAAALTLAAPLADLPRSYLEGVIRSARTSEELTTFDDALALETEAQRRSTMQPEFLDAIAAIRASIARR